MGTVLVTGANRGIGLEFARQYRGERVLGIVRDPQDAAELAATGAEVHGLDLRDAEGIARLGRALDGLAIDLLVANAGVYEGRDVGLDQTDPAWWLDAFRINAIGPLLLARALLGNLRAGTGRKVIAISSTFGSIGANQVRGHYAYRTSKAALNAGWRALSLDAPDLVCVLISPGHVRTRMSGPKAALSPEESVTAMRALIAGLGPADTGKFVNYQGKEIPW